MLTQCKLKFICNDYSCKMPQLSVEDRVTCTVLYREGWTQKRIAAHLGCSQNAVYLAIRRRQATGTHENRPKSGRPRISTPRDDRYLVRQCQGNRTLSVPALQTLWHQHGVTSSLTTVRRRLQSHGLNGRRPRKKPLLSRRNINQRLQFAREHQDWTWVDWSVVLFTDESKFNLYHNDGRDFVRRRKGEELLPHCIAPTVKFGGGGVMVWGAMSARGTGTLKTITGRMNGEGYIDILGDQLIPSAHLLGYGQHFILQDDNAPCHRARIVNEWKEAEGIRTLQWPAQSPDLNPIENLWSDLGRAVRGDHCVTLRELDECLHRHWDQIGRQTCMNLVRSMPRRIQAVLDARGGHTSY